jgi:hypothetical protein
VQDMLDFFTRQRQQGTEAAPTTPAPPTDTPNPARATPPVAPPPLPHLPLPGQGMHIASRVASTALQRRVDAGSLRGAAWSGFQ